MEQLDPRCRQWLTMSLTFQTKLLVVLLLHNVVIGNIFVCVLIKRDIFVFSKLAKMLNGIG